jgi:hypothetical protein
MKIQHLLLPTVALGAAATLLLPTNSDAYVLLGGSLSTSQRDIRIYDNFTDPSANDNVTPDTNFPGYHGVTVAIWKGALEWGSRLHGNGQGDPHQPGDLGSGGANFDVTFQGNATSIGGLNDNICSEIAGSSGGVLAYTETPISDGWRMRFYEGWTWADGPGTNIPANQIDIQGVACHEYGHALGLDHTTAAGATMQPAISGTGVTQRSISSDDIAGVQAVYGVASATKPIITGVIAGIGTLTINGSNFTVTGNQVWFTQLGNTSNGDPITVLNVNSTGTQLTVNVPVTAGPGDVLVKTSAPGNASLSNAWPFTPGTVPVCPSPYNYCFTSPNSVDPNGAYIGYAGTTLIANNDLTLITSSVPPNSAGLYFFGNNETYATFGNGYRCVAGSVFRLPIIQANLFGDAVYALNYNAAPALGHIAAGTTWKFQYWYRNPAGGGAGFNLSDALSVDFCP